MFRILISFALFFVLLGCKNSKNIAIEDIKRITFEYDLNQAINYTGKINAKVIAKLNDRSEVDITHHHDLLIDPTLLKITANKDEMVILKKANDFDDSVLVVPLEFRCKKDETYRQTDSIRINFLGLLNLDFSGSNGAKGTKGNNPTNPVIFKDGKNGGDGMKGEDGRDGSTIIVYVWKHAGMFHILTINQKDSTKTFNKLKVISDVSIYALGGKGGDGGRGGDGSSGKDGQITDKGKKEPGDGGNGGNGGIGGNGGNGGDVTIFVHTNANGLYTKLLVFNVAGIGGAPGAKGSGGNAGKALEGQTAATKGFDGRDGSNGSNGQKNGLLNGQILDFDFLNYHLLK